MPKDVAIVLSDGSINAAVTMALAAQKSRIVTVFFETTGAAGRRMQAFDLLNQHFKPARSYKIPMPFLEAFAAGESRAAIADPRAAANTTGQLVKLTPLIAVAARLAIHHGAKSIQLGLRLGPDSNELARAIEYGQIWTEMFQLTLDQDQLEVAMPLLELEMWQLVDLGFQVSAPMQHAWSCDQVVSEPCGQCAGCNAREAAFVRAGRPDPATIARRAG